MIESDLIPNRGAFAATMLTVSALAFMTSPLLARQGSDGSADGDDEIIAILHANPPMLTAERVPEGMKLGRCLLEVDGQTLVSGPCTYHYSSNESFIFNGPRQSYPGIDYSAEAVPMGMSTDHFVSVTHFPEDQRSAPELEFAAHYNTPKFSQYAQAYLGEFTRGDGECLTNVRARICLWKQ